MTKSKEFVMRLDRTALTSTRILIYWIILGIFFATKMASMKIEIY